MNNSIRVLLRIIVFFMVAIIEATWGWGELVGMVILAELLTGIDDKLLIWLALIGGVLVDVLKVRLLGWTSLALVGLLMLTWFYQERLAVKQKGLMLLVGAAWSGILRGVHGRLSLEGVAADLLVLAGVWLVLTFIKGSLGKDRGIYLS